MEIVKALALLLVGAGAGFVQRVSGFGIGIFSMLFLPYLMPTHAAAATVSTLFSCGACTYNAIKYRKNVAYKTMLSLLIGALIMIPVGVRLSVLISASLFERVLGVVLICLSIYFLFFASRIKVKANVPTGVLIGGIGGGLNGLVSIGGPPIVLYLTTALSDNLAYFATTQFYFAITNNYAIIMRALNGIVTVDVLLYALVGIVGCMVGDTLGKRVFDRLNATRLRQVIYVGMIISGILMVV